MIEQTSSTAPRSVLGAVSFLPTFPLRIPSMVTIYNLIPCRDGQYPVNYQSHGNYVLGGSDIPAPWTGPYPEVYERIYEQYRARYIHITITDRDGLGDSIHGIPIRIPPSHLVAIINGVWLGSIPKYIYRDAHEPRAGWVSYLCAILYVLVKRCADVMHIKL